MSTFTDGVLAWPRSSHLVLVPREGAEPVAAGGRRGKVRGRTQRSGRPIFTGRLLFRFVVLFALSRSRALGGTFSPPEVAVWVSDRRERAVLWSSVRAGGCGPEGGGTSPAPGLRDLWLALQKGSDSRRKCLSYGRGRRAAGRLGLAGAVRGERVYLGSTPDSADCVLAL